MCIGTPMTLLSVDGLVARAATRAGEELIADALDGLAASLRGESFDHLFADLIGRTPELPPHLRAHPRARLPGGAPEPTIMHRPGEAAE